MSWFASAPDDVAERIQAAHGAVNIPSLRESITRGAIGFTLVSLAGFLPWAVAGRWFYRRIGEGGLYAVCAAVFLGLSGLLLHRLLIGPSSLGRFYKVFTLAFIAYAIAWTAGWMSLRGHTGSVVGLLGGAVVMGLVLCGAFKAWSACLRVILTLFAANAAGYFVGGWLEATTPNLTGRLLWGVCYGVGLGAGLGYAFYVCQEPLRQRLRQMGESRAA